MPKRQRENTIAVATATAKPSSEPNTGSESTTASACSSASASANQSENLTTNLTSTSEIASESPSSPKRARIEKSASAAAEDDDEVQEITADQKKAVNDEILKDVKELVEKYLIEGNGTVPETVIKEKAKNNKTLKDLFFKSYFKHQKDLLIKIKQHAEFWARQHVRQYGRLFKYGRASERHNFNMAVSDNELGKFFEKFSYPQYQIVGKLEIELVAIIEPLLASDEKNDNFEIQKSKILEKVSVDNKKDHDAVSQTLAAAKNTFEYLKNKLAQKKLIISKSNEKADLDFKKSGFAKSEYDLQQITETYRGIVGGGYKDFIESYEKSIVEKIIQSAKAQAKNDAKDIRLPRNSKVNADIKKPTYGKYAEIFVTEYQKVFDEELASIKTKATDDAIKLANKLARQELEETVFNLNNVIPQNSELLAIYNAVGQEIFYTGIYPGFKQVALQVRVNLLEQSKIDCVLYGKQLAESSSPDFNFEKIDWPNPPQTEPFKQCYQKLGAYVFYQHFYPACQRYFSEIRDRIHEDVWDRLNADVSELVKKYKDYSSALSNGLGKSNAKYFESYYQAGISVAFLHHTAAMIQNFTATAQCFANQDFERQFFVSNQELLEKKYEKYKSEFGIYFSDFLVLYDKFMISKITDFAGKQAKQDVLNKALDKNAESQANLRKETFGKYAQDFYKAYVQGFNGELDILKQAARSKAHSLALELASKGLDDNEFKLSSPEVPKNPRLKAAFEEYGTQFFYSDFYLEFVKVAHPIREKEFLWVQAEAIKYAEAAVLKYEYWVFPVSRQDDSYLRKSYIEQLKIAFEKAKVRLLKVADESVVQVAQHYLQSNTFPVNDPKNDEFLKPYAERLGVCYEKIFIPSLNQVLIQKVKEAAIGNAKTDARNNKLEKNPHLHVNNKKLGYGRYAETFSAEYVTAFNQEIIALKKEANAKAVLLANELAAEELDDNVFELKSPAAPNNSQLKDLFDRHGSEFFHGFIYPEFRSHALSVRASKREEAKALGVNDAHNPELPRDARINIEKRQQEQQNNKYTVYFLSIYQQSFNQELEKIKAASEEKVEELAAKLALSELNDAIFQLNPPAEPNNAELYSHYKILGPDIFYQNVYQKFQRIAHSKRQSVRDAAKKMAGVEGEKLACQSDVFPKSISDEKKIISEKGEYFFAIYKHELEDVHRVNSNKILVTFESKALSYAEKYFNQSQDVSGFAAQFSEYGEGYFRKYFKPLYEATCKTKLISLRETAKKAALKCAKTYVDNNLDVPEEKYLVSYFNKYGKDIFTSFYEDLNNEFQRLSIEKNAAKINDAKKLGGTHGKILARSGRSFNESEIFANFESNEIEVKNCYKSAFVLSYREERKQILLAMNKIAVDLYAADKSVPKDKRDPVFKFLIDRDVMENFYYSEIQERFNQLKAEEDELNGAKSITAPPVSVTATVGDYLSADNSSVSAFYHTQSSTMSCAVSAELLLPPIPQVTRNNSANSTPNYSSSVASGKYATFFRGTALNQALSSLSENESSLFGNATNATATAASTSTPAASASGSIDTVSASPENPLVTGNPVGVTVTDFLVDDTTQDMKDDVSSATAQPQPALMTQQSACAQPNPLLPASEAILFTAPPGIRIRRPPGL